MTLRMQRKLLWFLTGLLGLGCMVVIGAGQLIPSELLQSDVVFPETASPDPFEASSTQSNPNPLPPLDSFLTLASRNYRQQLFDPPPGTAPPPKQPIPLPNFRLVGIVLNPSRPLAMIADGRGQVTLKTLGDRIGDENNFAVITAINSESISLEHAGRSVTVKKE